jgi:pyruvate/2-oxoglutarate dehydrogenase complex dihydrolipoamide acyltransferase (E2) component
MATRLSRRNRGYLLAAAISLALALGFSSCSHRLGWGLVLWSSSDGPLPAGSVVPVYIKSNINQVYVVGSLDGKKKVELPLWQIEVYGSKGKARAAAAKFAPVASLYLVAVRDGLPVRSTPTNVENNRVYRLHEGESVKILAKAEGEVVKTGDTALVGDWYFVLAADGTRGYVFSNTMRLFDELKESSSPALAGKTSGSSSVKIDVLFQKSWRPEYFQSEVDSGRVDLDLFAARFGLFTDAVHRQLRLETPTVSQVFQYSSIAEDGDYFVFEGTPLRIRFEGDRRLVADWSGLDAASLAAARSAANAAASAVAPAAAAPSAAGAAQAPKPPASSLAAASAASPAASSTSAVFVVLATDIRDAIRTEELRRQRLLDAFLSQGTDWALLLEPAAGPSQAQPAEGPAPAVEALPAAAASGPAQPSASRLGISGKGRFSWNRPELVPEGYLPQGTATGAPLSGDAAFRLYLAPGLEADWQGVLSLRFDGNPAWADFLYRMDSGSLVLSPVSGVSGLEAAGPNSLIPLSFSRVKTH